MTTIRSEIQKKAQSAILQYAIMRVESAVVIAGTILLTVLLPRPFGWWPIWGWPILGVLALAGLVYSSITDADANAQVILNLFQEQFNPREIKDRDLRQEVETGLEYQRRIEAQIRKQRPGVMRDRLEDTAGQISEWVATIFRLAQRLDAFRGDKLLDRERQAVPKEVESLTARRKLEGNPAVQQQLDDVLDAKRKQWVALRALDARMKQAQLQLDQSLTALATIYSQVQLVDAEDVNSGRAERLRTDIKEQVDRLNDLVSSINEVYNYQTEGLG